MFKWSGMATKYERGDVVLATFRKGRYALGYVEQVANNHLLLMVGLPRHIYWTALVRPRECKLVSRVPTIRPYEAPVPRHQWILLGLRRWWESLASNRGGGQNV